MVFIGCEYIRSQGNANSNTSKYHLRFFMELIPTALGHPSSDDQYWFVDGVRSQSTKPTSS